MVPIEGCEACGGVWLGPDGAVHILRGMADDLAREIERASDSVGARASSRPSDLGERACPTCAQPMGRLTIGHTIVDSCPAHGTWFDREEVAAVIKECSALRRERIGEREAYAEDEAARAAASRAREYGPGERAGENPVFSTFVDVVLGLLTRY